MYSSFSTTSIPPTIFALVIKKLQNSLMNCVENSKHAKIALPVYSVSVVRQNLETEDT